MEALVARLLDHWREVRGKPEPGATEAELAEVEARHGVRLPDNAGSGKAKVTLSYPK